MKDTLHAVCRLASLLVPLGCAVMATGYASGQEKPGTLTEADAQKFLVDSAWAKRVKMRSTVKAPTYVQSIETPGTQPGGLGPGGPGHGVVPPSADQILNQAAGQQTVPCLGWGVGSMSLPSPTSEECKAAWQSISAIKSAGLPEGSVIVLWESAEPIREAKSRLAIKEASGVKPDDAIVISVVAHPILRQINPSGSMKPMIRDSATLVRNGRISVQATDVSFVETMDTIMRFYFPRGAVQPEDKELTFRFEIQGTIVEAKFRIKDMQFRSKVAL